MADLAATVGALGACPSTRRTGVLARGGGLLEV